MPDETIHADLIDIAFERVGSGAFERFVNSFYPALAGINFVPLGGMHDGGADAMIEDVWTEGNAPGIFYQASVQKDLRSKVISTVARIQKCGRNPELLVYVTSKPVSQVDVTERELSKTTGVSVRIRDGAYLASQVNYNAQTRAAFRDHLGPCLDFLKHVGGSQLVAPSPHVRAPAVYVFLRQEIERRDGSRTLSEAVVDSLILWALEDTDPDAGRFLSSAEILSKIGNEFPFAKEIVPRHLVARLALLASKKAGPTGREIRHHAKESMYCLPYETRKQVMTEAAAEEALKIRVLSQLERRVCSSGEVLVVEDQKLAGTLAMRTVQLMFEREGLEFAAFLNEGGATKATRESLTLAECADYAVMEAKVSGIRAESIKVAIMSALRGSFYTSTPEERLFFGKLARTYSLLFGIQAEPRIVEFFQDMASDFYLYVGTDMIVRALSERYVPAEDQRVRTLLRMVAQAGAKLILAEPVLDEVASHLRVTALEYRNFFADRERDMTFEIARQCPKILIRAYLYARLVPPPGIAIPASWSDYLRQFCDPGRLGTAGGREELRRYLLSTFSMEFEDQEKISALVATDTARSDLEEVAVKLGPNKAIQELAENDALMALAVYGRRERNGEMAKSTVFGYRTWWLTSETSILKHTRKIVEARGARYMMRPEFLLNFLSMAPKVSDVRAAYESIFPSLLGIRLANRVKDDVYRDMMTKVKEADELEPGRREALVAKYSDRLKSDFRRVYETKL